MEAISELDDAAEDDEDPQRIARHPLRFPLGPFRHIPATHLRMDEAINRIGEELFPKEWSSADWSNFRYEIIRGRLYRREFQLLPTYDGRIARRLDKSIDIGSDISAVNLARLRTMHACVVDKIASDFESSCIKVYKLGSSSKISEIVNKGALTVNREWVFFYGFLPSKGAIIRDSVQLKYVVLLNRFEFEDYINKESRLLNERVAVPGIKAIVRYALGPLIDALKKDKKRITKRNLNTVLLQAAADMGIKFTAADFERDIWKNPSIASVKARVGPPKQSEKDYDKQALIKLVRDCLDGVGRRRIVNDKSAQVP